MPLPILFALMMLVSATIAWAGDKASQRTLLDIGPAPEFVLVSQNGKEIGLAGFRGKVVVIAFIYTWCPDICPLLTDKMARVQDGLGEAFGRDVVFVSITFDPKRDTAAALRDYAEAFDADPAGWYFLTGDVATVRKVVAQYGVVTFPAPQGAIDHNLLTTIVDRRGRIRVQYAGYRFDPKDLHRDVRALMAEK